MYPIICSECKEEIGEQETLDGLIRICDDCQ